MPNQNSNSVAIVAIIVIALLIAGGGFVYYMNGSSHTVERETVIERPAPKDEPAFQLKLKDEKGNEANIQADDE